MKKISRIMFATLLLALLSISAYASEPVTYNLDAIGMSIAIPPDMVVFTRDTPENDPNLKKYGIERGDMLKEFELGDKYLEAFQQHDSYEVVVSATYGGGVLPEFNKYSDSEIIAYGDSLIKSNDDSGITYIKSDAYSNSNAKFLKMYIEMPSNDTTAYGIICLANINGTGIRISIQSIGKEITPATEESTLANTTTAYRNDDAVVSFLIPVGWRKSADSSADVQAEFIDIAGNSIGFSYIDLWAKMEDSLKQAYPRSSCDNSAVTEDDIKTMFTNGKTTAKSVDTETFNDIEYFKVILQYTTSVVGVSINTTNVRHVMLYDGIMYVYYYNGDTASSSYKDYASVLSSVKYDNLSSFSSAPNMTKHALGLPANASTDTLSGVIVLDIIFTIVLYSLPIIVYRYAIKKSPVPPAKAKKITIIYGIFAFIAASIISFLAGNGSPGCAVVIWSYINYAILKSGGPKDDSDKSNSGGISDAPPDAPIAPKIIICKGCGAALAPDSTFCYRCGTEQQINNEC